MSIQRKQTGRFETTGPIDGIRKKDIPTESDSKRMSEWLRKRGEMRIPFKRSIRPQKR